MYYNSLERMLIGVYLALTFINFIAYYKRAKKTENSNEKAIVYGISFIFLGVCLGTFFLFLAQLYDYSIFTGYFSGDAFYMDFSEAQEIGPSNFPLIQDIYVWGFLLSEIIALIVFLFILERIAKKTKYALTVIFSVITIIGMVLPYELSVGFLVGFAMAPLMLFLIISVYLFPKWTSEEFKPFCLVLLSGLMLNTIGDYLVGHPVKRLGIVPIELGPIFYILAMIVLLFVPFTESEILVKNSKYVKLLTIGCLTIFILISIFLLLQIRDMTLYVQIPVSIGLNLIIAYSLLRTKPDHPND